MVNPASAVETVVARPAGYVSSGHSRQGVARGVVCPAANVGTAAVELVPLGERERRQLAVGDGRPREDNIETGSERDRAGHLDPPDDRLVDDAGGALGPDTLRGGDLLERRVVGI